MITTVAILLAVAMTEPVRWTNVPKICNAWRMQGWRPADPLSNDDSGPGSVTVGGSLKIHLCRLRRELPRGKGSKPASLELFMQHRGGTVVTLTANFWDAADRNAALEAAGTTMADLARELSLPLPPYLTKAIREAEDIESDEDDLRIEVSTSTRESELRLQPDLKPGDVPLLAVAITIKEQ